MRVVLRAIKLNQNEAFVAAPAAAIRNARSKLNFVGLSSFKRRQRRLCDFSLCATLDDVDDDDDYE